jgi:hypothetical protein
MYLPQDIHGTLLLVFVSARTNKRHHQLQMTYTVENPHTDDSVMPGTRPHFRPPRSSDPTTRQPHPQQQDGWKPDFLSSASKDVTAHLHLP